VAKARFAYNLSDVVIALRELKPRFSTQRRALEDIIETLLEVEGIVETIEAFRPGVLSALESNAAVEMQVIHDKVPREVSALIGRYTKRVHR
jgi:hypothetical protein